MKNRVHENPVQKDTATFIETSAETGGKRTLVDVEVAPGGGNGSHYHKAYTETFTVLEGELKVLKGKKYYTLKAGETASIPPNTVHCFSNPTPNKGKFRVEITPGHEGFENGIRVAYGLARDGFMRKDGTPKSFSHLALLVVMTDSNVSGFLSILMPIFKWVAKRARKKGVEAMLIKKYGD